MPDAPSTFRLILWPSVFTLALSLTRLVAERQGWSTTVSGGAGAPLGITWGLFVFGAWFGGRLSRANAGPRVARPWLWALLALLAAGGTAAYGFRPLVGGDQSDATFALVRQAVLATVVVTTLGALAMFRVWPRLAWTMFVYGLIARATVVAITWFAKSAGWNTHYTKFGPTGIERGMGETMLSAAVAQFGFWVPLTILGGTLAGGLLARRRA